MASKSTNRRFMAACVIVAVAIGVVIGIRLYRQRVFLRHVLVPSDSSGGNPYKYDLKELLKVDPALVKYSETDTVRVPLQKPYGLAADGKGNMYVVGDSMLLIIDKDGEVKHRIHLSAPATCVAVDAKSVIYLGIGDHVAVYNADGKKLSTWKGLGQKAILTSIAASQEDVFVADAGNQEVLRYDSEGEIQKRIGKKDEVCKAPGLIVPSPFMDVAVDSFDHLWVVNPGRHTIESYADDGDFRSAWGKASVMIEGFCGCCNPMHMAIMESGAVVTSEKGLPRVKVYNPDGSLFGVVAPPSHFKRGTVGLDLAVDSAGRILVLDPKVRVVRVFELKRPEDEG